MTSIFLLPIKDRCLPYGICWSLALLFACLNFSNCVLGQEENVVTDKTPKTVTDSEITREKSESEGIEKNSASATEAEISTDSELNILTEDRQPNTDDSTSNTTTRPDFPLRDDKPIYETTNPEWIFKAPAIENNSLMLYVGGELCSTQEECEEKQPEAILAELAKYLDEKVLLSQGAAMKTPLRNLMENHDIEEEKYFATVRTSEGTFYQLWTKVRFDATLTREVKKAFLAGEQPGRIRIVGLSLIPIMGGLLALHLSVGAIARKRKTK